MTRMTPKAASMTVANPGMMAGSPPRSRQTREGAPVPEMKPSMLAPAQVGGSIGFGAATSTSAEVTHEDIARAAYLRWEKLGGDPENNWIEAERELRGRSPRQS